MKRTSFAAMRCPIARGLERVGEWWSMLILRDAIRGNTRFEEFQTGLPIAPNMLSRRLEALVRAGLLARRRYRAHPPRYAYRLTDRGRDFFPVLVALMNWGNKHFPAAGAPSRLLNARTGSAVDAAMVDLRSGRVLNTEDYQLSPATRTVHHSVPAEGVQNAERMRKSSWPRKSTPLRKPAHSNPFRGEK